MKKLICYLCVAVSAVLLSAGCAGQKAARETARVLVGQTLLLEQDINKKIAAEAQYYSNSTATLLDAAQREGFQAEEADITRSASAFAQQMLSSDKRLSAADIQNYLEKSTQQTWSEVSNVMAQGQVEAAAFSAAMQKLDAKMETLQSVRRILENLQSEPDLITRGQELIEFGNQVKKTGGVTNLVNSVFGK